MIAADEPDHADVVQEAGQDHLLVVAVLERVGGALEQMVLRGREAILEEVEQSRLLRHLRQARVVAHQHVLARIGGRRRRLGRVEIARGEQHRLPDTAVHLRRQVLLKLLGALRERGARREGQPLGDVLIHPWNLLDAHVGAPPANSGCSRLTTSRRRHQRRPYPRSHHTSRMTRGSAAIIEQMRRAYQSWAGDGPSPAPPYHGASRLRRLSTALARTRARGSHATTRAWRDRYDV